MRGAPLHDVIPTHTLSNGMILIAEHMPHVRSATFYFLTPAGCAYDPPEKSGLATVLAEMIERGAGDLESESLTLALDNLGVDRGESVGLYSLSLSAGTLARGLPAALEIYADILRSPHLPQEDLEAARDLALADLQAIDDSPQDQVMLELRRRFYPPPLNRDRCGTADGLLAVTHQDVQRHFRLVRPNGTILSVAGNIDWKPLVDQVERLFGDWPRGEDPGLRVEPQKALSVHIPKDTQQTQIAAAFPSVPLSHPSYFAALGAVSVLSGGMSSRLFTEVREKRGLCYSVGATYEPLKDRGTVLAHSASRPERAQETLEVLLSEMSRLREGISEDELDRVRAGLKTSLIMQQESTVARARALARDWHHLGRVRSFDEIQAAIDGLSTPAILDYCDAFPLTKPTIVTLGSSPLAFPE